MSAPVHVGAGAALSQATVHGGVAYLAGQVADDGSAPIAEQTRSVLSRIDACLAEVGSDRSHLLRVVIWLRDIDDFAEMDRVWREWLDGAPPPARATAQATLADAAWRVEMIATAAVPEPGR
jgi:enamine deaminase RidA (YjgF/YER057c/UK114 family)